MRVHARINLVPDNASYERRAPHASLSYSILKVWDFQALYRDVTWYANAR